MSGQQQQTAAWGIGRDRAQGTRGRSTRHFSTAGRFELHLLPGLRWRDCSALHLSLHRDLRLSLHHSVAGRRCLHVEHRLRGVVCRHQLLAGLPISVPGLRRRGVSRPSRVWSKRTSTQNRGINVRESIQDQA